MAKKILIIGSGGEGKSALMLQKMKEKYGDDIELYTPEEAREQGLTPADFGNIPSYKIQAPEFMGLPAVAGYTEKCGRQKRRDRRKKRTPNQKV